MNLSKKREEKKERKGSEKERRGVEWKSRKEMREYREEERKTVQAKSTYQSLALQKLLIFGYLHVFP
jgi:hypothetical protein